MGIRYTKTWGTAPSVMLVSVPESVLGAGHGHQG